MGGESGPLIRVQGQANVATRCPGSPRAHSVPSGQGRLSPGLGPLEVNAESPSLRALMAQSRWGPPGGNPARRLRVRAALGWNASDPAHEARDPQQVAETVQASASILPSEDGQQQEPILPGTKRCTQPPRSSLSGRAAVSIVFRAVAPVASMEAAAEGARAIGRVTPG